MDEIEQQIARLERIVVGERGTNGLRGMVFQHDISLYGDDRAGHSGLVTEIRAMRRWFQAGVGISVLIAILIVLTNPNVIDAIEAIGSLVP